MPQTSMTQNPAVAQNGELAYPLRPKVVDTKVVADTAGIPYGVFVAKAAAGTVKVPVLTGDVTATGVGFMYLDDTRQFNTVGVPLNGNCAILRKGYIYVLTETAFAEEGAVFARFTANGGNTQLGKIRNDTDSGNAVAVPNARFVTTGSAAGLAIVEVF